MPNLSAIPFVPGLASGTLRFGPASAASDVIVVLRQHELAALGKRPAGIVLVDGAPFSHPALRLLSQAIPTVLAHQGQVQELVEGEDCLLDGQGGRLSQPAPAVMSDDGQLLPPEPGKPVSTLDGVSVALRASIGSAAGSAAAVKGGAAGIGLVRTEYLFPPDGKRPQRDFLADAFARICQAAQPLPVTFRLVDVARDKLPPWFGNVADIGILGLQGARLYGMEPVRQVFFEELAALETLADRYPVALLLPYVASPGELEHLAAEIRQHLPASVRLGVMLETPAAALAVDDFLDVADFAALGCNDLMQCLFAADRDLPALRAFLDPHAPALFRFLESVAERADNKLGIIQVCGLLPQWQGILPVLLGLGYRVFSVDPVMIPWLAQTVRKTDTRQAVRLARAVCEARRSEKVRRLLEMTNSPA